MWNVKATRSATGYTSINSNRIASQASNELLMKSRIASRPTLAGAG